MPPPGARKVAKPTHEDAAILLQVAQLAAASGVQGALNWVFSDAFLPDYAEFIKKHPRGGKGFAAARLLAVHYETIGTLWKNKLINEDLLFDWLAVTLVWDRLKGIVLGERKAFGVPALGENFQKMANAQARRLKAAG